MLEKEVIPIALIPGKIETLLGEFKEEVCRNPAADFTSCIKSLAAKFREIEKERERGVVFALFLNLYALDAHSLGRDLAKLKVLGMAQATPSQRVALLRCLYGVVSLYLDDLDAIISMYDQVEDDYKDSSSALDMRG